MGYNSSGWERPAGARRLSDFPPVRGPMPGGQKGQLPVASCAASVVSDGGMLPRGGGPRGRVLPSSAAKVIFTPAPADEASIPAWPDKGYTCFHERARGGQNERSSPRCSGYKRVWRFGVRAFADIDPVEIKGVELRLRAK